MNIFDQSTGNSEPEKTVDYMILNEGELDPTLNKCIKVLILKTPTFIVYLDEALEVEWSMQNHHHDHELGNILNKVACLESRSKFIEDNVILLSARRQIAEGLARYLDSLSVEQAIEIFEQTEKEIETRNRELSWGWYFHTAYILTVVFVVVFVVFWLCRDEVSSFVGVNALHIILAACSGSIGAIISIIARGNKIDIDANAGKEIHITEGVARVVTGVAGAAFVALAIKGGIILGGIKFAGNNLAMLLTFCIAAGASERIVPNLINKIETGLEKETNKEQGKKGKGSASPNPKK